MNKQVNKTSQQAKINKRDKTMFAFVPFNILKGNYLS